VELMTNQLLAETLGITATGFVKMASMLGSGV
jgi:hypothetical protein